MSLLIFTDLDGTLLDVDSYSAEPASKALEELTTREFPVVLASSKTSAEITAIQTRLKLDGPFICENGAALHLGKNQKPELIEFGEAKRHWLDKVHQLRTEKDYKFSGFSDMSVDEVRDITGLSINQAISAKDRRYSEPVRWLDSSSALREFEEHLSKLDLRLQEGGRFHSIQGQYDKSDAMRWFSKQVVNKQAITVALGDSPNDRDMLEQADIAVVINSPKSEQLHPQSVTKLIRTQRPGPAGWQEAMDLILDLYDRHQLESK